VGVLCVHLWIQAVVLTRSLTSSSIHFLAHSRIHFLTSSLTNSLAHQLTHPLDSNDARFVCQASSLEFLTKHRFNFNKFIYEGVPFLSREQEERARRHLTRPPKPFKPLVLKNEADHRFIATV
jgi:CAF1 family ribonuclease